LKKQLMTLERGKRHRPGSEGTDEHSPSHSPLDIDALDQAIRGARAYGTDASLLRDLWRAHHKYITRTKIDATSLRERALVDILRTGMKFRDALEQYELASRERRIVLPPDVPEGLNAQSVDRLIVSCRNALKAYDNAAQWRTAINKITQLGLEKGSALEFFLGSLLPQIFERHYKCEVELRSSDGFADTPFIRFAITVCEQLGVVGKSGRPPKRETIVKACSLYRKDVSRRKSRRV